MRRAVVAICIAPLALAGCELREVSLTEPELAVVAEAYVTLGVESGLVVGLPNPKVAAVFLHETFDAEGGSGPVSGARVSITRIQDALRIPLEESSLRDCVLSIPIRGSGTCYQPPAGAPLDSLNPGDRLALLIELPDGGVLESETVIPLAFELRNVPSAGVCVLPPARQAGIMWTRSSGAWAYISDTFISGLGPIFGSAVVDDPLYLWGLSVSAQDTTIAFPGEFGLFARVELDQEVSLALQQGLPPETSAVVTVAAVDRNWVNWARGGSFNPSGLVRVPSVRGEGTGVFAAGVLHTFRVVAGTPGRFDTECPHAPEVGPEG